MENWVIGADLGGTKVELGLVNARNEIVARRRMPTRPEEGPGSLIQRLGAAVDDLRADVPSHAHLSALGICSPGPVDHVRGTLSDPPNLQGLHNMPLRDLLQARSGVPVVLEHDAKAAALGDFHYGAGRDADDMVFVVVGTGVGAAVIVDGELVRGRHNAAGEIGHITLDRNGDLCSCGNRGCVETFLSGPRLAQRYARAAAVDASSMDGKQVTTLAAQGDPLARQVFVEAGEALGRTVATMAMTLDVSLYVIGGSVVNAGELLLAPARRAVPRHCFASVGARVVIAPTTLGGDGPILGCAWLAGRSNG